MQTITVHTSQNIDIDYEVASLGDRILAYLIDGGIFFLVYILGIIIYFSSQGSGAAVNGVLVASLLIIYFALFVFYDLICELFLNGQSIGKRLMKIKVISLDGSQPTIGQYLLRWLFRIVDFTFTSGLCALISTAVSENKQRVGDMVAGTTLIKTVPRTKADHIAFTPVLENYEPTYPQVNQLNDRDIELIHEVIHTYMQTGNTTVVYNMAEKVREHLNVAPREDIDSLQFLQLIIKDYNYTLSAGDPHFNA
jgi:uncharacterized RDD family membrane protein YckC